MPSWPTTYAALRNLIDEDLIVLYDSEGGDFHFGRHHILDELGRPKLSNFVAP